MTAFNRYLILNSNGDGRVTSRYPTRLRNNEVAFKLLINVPDGWADISEQVIKVELPPPPDADDVEVRA